jgi:hypothetical protein
MRQAAISGLIHEIFIIKGAQRSGTEATISNHVPANEQGELQEALTDFISITKSLVYW